MDEQDGLSPQELAALALSNPTAFARAFAILIKVKGNGEYNESDIRGENSRSVAGIWDKIHNSGEVHGGVTVRCVLRDGGTEGSGESVERVYKIELNSKIVCFIRSTGSYYSEEGTYWDDVFSLVYPHEVLVTQYHNHPQVKA